MLRWISGNGALWTTIDDLAIRRNVEKAIPEAAATLNHVLFSEG